MEDSFVPIFLKIPAEKIVLLKFLLESYEGLGELRTLNNEEAIVVILALKDTEKHVQIMLDSEKASLLWEQIPTPENLNSDWLLRTSE